MRGPVSAGDDDSWAAHLMDVMHRLRHAWGNVHPELPVRRGDIMLLGCLLDREEHAQPPATVGDLARQLKQSPSAITQKVNVLEEQGFLQRTADASDRRMACVELTGKGREMAQRAIKAVWGRLDEALDSLGPDNSRELVRLLECLCDNLEEKP